MAGCTVVYLSAGLMPGLQQQHHNSKMYNTPTTDATEDAAELLEELDQNKLAPVYAFNTGLAALYSCNTLLYE